MNSRLRSGVERTMRALLAVLGALALAAVPVDATRADGLDDDSGDGCAERAVRAIQGRYEGIEDLRADFVQTTRSVAFGAGAPGASSSSRGTVQLAKPGRMRWSYESPEPSLVVSDGSTLWIYDPANREVQRMQVGQGFLSGAAIQFLLGEGDLLEEFRVTADSCSDAVAELSLVPREAATYEKLHLRANPSSGDVASTRVVDLLGNVTEVSFSDLETNLAPPPETFRFEAPEGVEVIDLGMPAPPGGGAR